MRLYSAYRDRLALSVFPERLVEIVDGNRDEMFVVCGDFNLPGIKWDVDELNSCYEPKNFRDPSASLFVDSMSLSGLTQFNGFAGVSGNVLDLVLSNNYLIEGLKVSDHPLMPEDPCHNTLEFLIRAPICSRKNMGNSRGRNFNMANYDALNEALGSVDWGAELSFLSVDQSVDRFYQIIDGLLDSFVPLLPRYCRKYPSWFSLSSVRAVREKTKFHKRWKKYGNDIDYSTYRLLRGRTEFLIEQDYRKFIESMEINLKLNPKSFWRYVRAKRNSPCVPDCIRTPGGIVADRQIICDLFSEYFGSVFLPSSVGNLAEYPEAPLHVGSYTISRDKIKEKIMEMKNVGPGPDGIPPSFLKSCLERLVEPLFILFNRSLMEGCFPERWKFSKVVPVFKSGDKNLLEKYRPISKLCVIGKLFEGIVTDFLFFDVKNILNTEQHGFVKKRSVDTNLFTFVVYVLGSMDSGYAVDSVYTDFSKAFDKIDHSIIISKLADVGVHGSLLRWLDSYLRNRSQRVVLSQYCSE
ncbi:uncharacterized protein LOC123313016 [Coccinella septempunctata]|uniref:uncharacterized protein LOC123313016 n=1 Tax=Coccinella septempunctata TaxID=41139 RepID=UPI001D096C9A|nr:uncharacterized protein LOC123313016 [Coccinella septempunctata]